MGWEDRFFATTRGRVIGLLRRSEHTVAELAEALGLTDNAVRVHLASLERDGLVEPRGVRRAIGKPAYVYGLTEEAERLFSKAYAPVLGQLLDLLVERLGRDRLASLLEEAGRRAVAGREWPAAPEARVEAVLELVRELGGLAEVEEREGEVVVQGYSCPLAAVVPGHPEVCRLVESLLEESLGAPVRERCDRGPRPRCAFVVERTDGPAA